MTNKIFLFIINDPAFFLSHRLPLAVAAQKEGFNVHVATMDGAAVKKILQIGLVHHKLPLSRSGKNPLAEISSFFAILRLLRELKPELIHLVTIKPVLYGGIAARLVNVPSVVSAISGLGFLFVKRAGLRRRLLYYIVLFLYRLAMGHLNQRVIFQNSSDMNALVKAGGVQINKTNLIRGSGVDLRDYPVTPEPEGNPVVVMASRLLKDKGVHEFVEAARILKSQGIKARFQLIGDPDPGNPESVTAKSVQTWREEGIVECLGFRSDIPRLFSKAHVVTLPSYYGEGLPKVLIEAAACGRAVITTDMPGCRDAIESDRTGILVPTRDVDALAKAMELLIKDVALRQKMGIAGRALAESEFGIEKVVEVHLAIYRKLSGITGS